MERINTRTNEVLDPTLSQLLAEGVGGSGWIIIKRGNRVKGRGKKAVFYNTEAGVYAKIYDAQSSIVPTEISAQNFQAGYHGLTPKPWAWAISGGGLSAVFSRRFGPSVMDAIKQGTISLDSIPELCSRLVNWVSLIEDKTGLYNRDINPQNVLLVGGRLDGLAIIDWENCLSGRVGKKASDIIDRLACSLPKFFDTLIFDWRDRSGVISSTFKYAASSGDVILRCALEEASKRNDWGL